MPTAVLYTIVSESDEPKLHATFTYNLDDCFADARLKIEHRKLVDFDFDFLDAHLGIRMLPISEKGNLIDECFGKVIVLRKLSSTRSGLTTLSTQQPSRNLSSVSSNGISTTCTQPESQPSQPSSPWPHNIDHESMDYGVDDQLGDELPEVGLEDPCEEPLQTTVQDEPVPLSDTVVDPHVSMLSTLMPADAQRAWSLATQRLKEHMKFIMAGDHRWQVRTWDSDGVPRGNIWCIECEHPFQCSSRRGAEDKIAINNCFTNFKSKHLTSGKHLASVAKYRKQKLDASTVQKRVAAKGPSTRETLEQQIRIVESVNTLQSAAQSVDNVTFTIVGDMDVEVLDLKKFKVRCEFCCEHIVLVPAKNNLQSNLQTHCAGLSHLTHVSRSQRPASGLPVLSGKAGRPRVGDKRDRSQKSIQGFYSPQTRRVGSNSTSRASASDKGKGTIHSKSLGCWGMWRESVQWGDQTRPIKHLLLDQLKVQGEWYAEPLLVDKVWCLTSGTLCEISGTFRHTKCSRVSELGGGFEDLTCEQCHRIKYLTDFRLRVLREERALEKRGTRGTGAGRRLGYLNLPEIQRQAQSYKGHMYRERKQCRRLQHRLLMLRMRSPRLKEVCTEAANRKDLLKFCNNIVLAQRSGAFGGREALWDMLRDIASNLNRKKNGHRFKKGTKLLMQTLFMHGGRRVIDCLATNAIGPSLNTLQRDRRIMCWFRVGIHEEQFQFIAAILSRVKAQRGITGPIPVYLAEDETSVKRTVRWQPKNDTLLGFCGATESHLCKAGLEIKVGDGDVGFKNITQSFDTYVVGHQARCIIVNPLVEGFPRLCLMATGTCSKFDSDWVRHQWQRLESMWSIHCLEAVGPILGHASDGDSRRRKLMLHDYTGQGTEGQKVNLGWDGWQLTHSMTKDGPVRHAFGLHDQDYIHNQKKLVNPMDSCSRHLKPGAETITIAHVAMAYELYSHEDHGMNHEDVLRTDRQNWASAQRLCSRKVANTLRMLRERKDVKRERTLGTETYLTICADYMDVFLNTHLTLRERVVLCAKVGFFFRLWRLWCFHGDKSVGGNTLPVTFGKSCIPMQTFLDIQMSVHMVVFLIIQFRDNFKSLPVPLHLTGSDACEQFFSKVGGMRGHERSYDLAELVECATNVNRLAAMDLTEGLVGVGKSHKKHTNIWMKLHTVEGETVEPADLTDYTGVETNAEIVDALKEGLKLAQEVTILLDMKPASSWDKKLWWKEPWKIEEKGVNQGGWCDVNVDDLDPLDALDPDEPGHEAESVHDTPESFARREEPLHAGDGVPDIQVADMACRDTMGEVFSDLVYGGKAEDVNPIVTFDGRQMYKSTLVSQLVGNPHLSKDRLTRVKQSVYFNNVTDKPRRREGYPSMMMGLGSDVGVFFVQKKAASKKTGSTTTIVEALTGKAKGKRKKSNAPLAKRARGHARGEPVSLSAAEMEGLEYVWWIGRIQFIMKKYGSRFCRSRDDVDLLDRPGGENVCRVICNWFSPCEEEKNKFVYDIIDHQEIDLDCVITTVHLTVNPERPDVFEMDQADVDALDDYVKNKVR